MESGFIDDSKSLWGRIIRLNAKNINNHLKMTCFSNSKYSFLSTKPPFLINYMI